MREAGLDCSSFALNSVNDILLTRADRKLLAEMPVDGGKCPAPFFKGLQEDLDPDN